MGDSPAIVLIAAESASCAALSDAFERAGYRTRIAADSADAIQFAAGNGVDLVVLGLDLPGMDGMQALRMIRSAQSKRYLPVIVVSSRLDAAGRIAALDLGADEAA